MGSFLVALSGEEESGHVRTREATLENTHMCSWRNRDGAGFAPVTHAGREARDADGGKRVRIARS